MNSNNICTIEEWSVDWNELGNTLLCTHEYIHKSLSVTSVYGVIQHQIKFYSDYFPEDIPLKRIQYELFKNVIFLQECCATFCSVMQIADSMENNEQLLPISYMKYYDTFFNCFKCKINSTYFAFILAETIAQACMNTRIHTKIIDFFNNTSGAFSTLPFAPDHYFRVILKNIDSNILEEIIDYCNYKNPDKYSNLNSDNYWKNHTLEQINQLNDIVFNAAYNYISQKFCKLKILPLETIQKDSFLWINLLNVTLISNYGDIGFSISLNHSHPYELNANLLLVLECLDSAKIYNKPHMRSNKPLPSNDLLGINFKPYHQKLNLHTYLCENCYFENDGNWYQFNSNGESFDVAYFHFKNLPNFIAKNPLFVIGIVADTQTTNFVTSKISMINHTLKNLCINSNPKIKSFTRYNVMFYMFGKFSCWIDYLVQYPKCKFNILDIDDKNSAAAKTNSFAMIAIYSPALSGIFIKCFNTLNYSKTLQLLDSLSSQHLITPNYSKESFIVASKMKQAFDAIDSLWLEF